MTATINVENLRNDNGYLSHIPDLDEEQPFIMRRNVKAIVVDLDSESECESNLGGTWIENEVDYSRVVGKEVGVKACTEYVAAKMVHASSRKAGF